MDAKIIEYLLKYGLGWVLLAAFLFLIVQDPSRAEKLKALLTSPFFKLFKWFSKSHIASTINANINEFLRKEVNSQMLQKEKISAKIKFVAEAEDPILKKNGTVIICLKETNDQTKNILNATQIILPEIVCPYIRKNLEQYLSKAIDLTFLKKFADQLGNHGKLTFKKYFLDPETQEDININESIQKLIKIDISGLFVSIFINELNYIGEGLYADIDKKNRTEEVLGFLQFLITIAEREIGDEIELEYFSEVFNVGIILLAKTKTAMEKGLKPYIDRLHTKFKQGCESTYIIAFPNAWNFLDTFMESLKNNKKILLNKTFIINNYLNNKSNRLKVSLIRNNKLFTDKNFINYLESNSLKIGELVEGRVINVSREIAFIRVIDSDAHIKRVECSWNTINSCEEVLSDNAIIKFRIKNINISSSNLELSLRFEDQNPWQHNDVPNIGDRIMVKVIAIYENKLQCLYNNIEVFIPLVELSWQEINDNYIDYIGQNLECIILKKDKNNNYLEASIRQTIENPWEDIYKRFPANTELTGKVIRVEKDYVFVEIANGIYGKIDGLIMKKAGYEYKDYINNVVVGQGLQVVIKKVWIGRRKITLDLKRNIKQPPKF